MKKIFSFNDLPLDQNKMLKERINDTMQELSKYPWEIAVHVIHSIFLKIIYWSYPDEKERDEMIKTFDEVRNMTFRKWNEIQQHKIEK